MTVRSFHSAWNETPWSMPKMLPSSVARRQCPPLRSVLLIDDVERGHASELVSVLREQREVVLLGIVVHEALHHPDADRSVAKHGVGDDRPAQRFRHFACRDLAVAQRPAGKSQSGRSPRCGL